MGGIGIFSSTAHVPTANGRRYMQQLLKHWSHNLTVEFDDEQGHIVFPRDTRGADWPGDGHISMLVGPSALEVRVTASAPQQRDGLKGAAQRHLDRFAFREAPLAFSWDDEVSA
jgi:hypothetical protein